MRRTTPLLAVMLALGSVNTATAQALTELVPEDAAAAVLIRNLDELRIKGDKFIADARLNLPLRPSELFTAAYTFLGVQQVVDVKGSAGILLMPPEGKEKLGLDNLERLLVPVVPFRKRDDLADVFRADKERLAAGAIAPAKGMNFGSFAYAGPKHLYVSNDRRTLERVRQSKAIAAALTPRQRAAFDDSDLVIHLGTAAWRDEWHQMLKEQEEGLVKELEPEGAKAAHTLISALGEARFVTAGVQLDAGLGMHFLAMLPANGTGANLIDQVRHRGPASTLAGLPDGRVVAAQAHAGRGRDTAAFARVLFNFLLRETLEGRQLISAADRTTFVGVFEDIWQRLNGSRLALYLTPDESRLGLFSAVAILDADDAGKFLRELRMLARIADGTKLDLTRPAAPDGIDIAQLVRDLGSEDYPTRQAAHVRLTLIGEPAMAYLNKHLDAGALDLVTKRRIERLQDHIGRVAAERRKELLGKDVVKYPRPSFVFVPEAEKRAGVAVDVVRLKLSADQKIAGAAITQLLGPDWDKLRLAVVGNRVAVLLGSDVSLLEAAVRNLSDSRPGLADAKFLDTFRKRATADRQVELHIDVETLLGLTAANPPPRRTQSRLTSIALGLGTHHVTLDGFVPAGDVRAVAGKIVGR